MMKKIILTALVTIGLGFVYGQGYKVGDKVKDFSLENVITKKEVSLESYKGDAKGYIVIFTCNHCPFAKATWDRVIKLNSKYAPKGYPVITISPNDPKVVPEDSPEKMEEFAKEKNMQFPYLFDANHEVVKQFGATKTPHVFILQKEKGNFFVRYIGAIDDNTRKEDEVSEKYVEEAVNSLLAGKPVKVKTTKAIGCSVKYQN